MKTQGPEGGEHRRRVVPPAPVLRQPEPIQQRLDVRVSRSRRLRLRDWVRRAAWWTREACSQNAFSASWMQQ